VFASLVSQPPFATLAGSYFVVERGIEMPRIRSIKPDYWDHEQLGRLSTLARLTFVGMWNWCDDEGVVRADPDWLWGRLHSYAPNSVKARWKPALRELEAVEDDRGHILHRYEVGGAAYYWIPGLKRQQYIQKPQPAKYPTPPDSVTSTVMVSAGEERKGEERKGGEGRGIGRENSPPSSPSAWIKKAAKQYRIFGSVEQIETRALAWEERYGRQTVLDAFKAMSGQDIFDIAKEKFRKGSNGAPAEPKKPNPSEGCKECGGEGYVYIKGDVDRHGKGKSMESCPKCKLKAEVKK